jgi:PRC-barrel domain
MTHTTETSDVQGEVLTDEDGAPRSAPLETPGTDAHAAGGEPPTSDPGAGDVALDTQPPSATYNVADWRGKLLVDRSGHSIGKLQDVYVDVETDEPRFGTVKEGFFGRHLTFVPLDGVSVDPDHLQVAVDLARVKDAPNLQHGEELSQADESHLYHHFELNYTPPNTNSGRRLARR